MTKGEVEGPTPSQPETLVLPPMGSKARGGILEDCECRDPYLQNKEKLGWHK